MKQRILTAVVLIPFVLAAVFCMLPWPIATLLFILALIGVSEIVRMTGQVLAAYGVPLVFLAIAVTIPGNYNIAEWRQVPYQGEWQSHVAFSGLFMFGLAIAVTLALKPPPAKSQVHALLASGWILGPCASLFALHQSVSYDHVWHLPNPVLMAVLPLWAGDTAAIFAGRAFGKRKLAPKISPKKTVEGAVANLAACILAAWACGNWIGVPIPQSLACGTFAGILGQAGDLFESWVKRRANLKDSGTLLPGHGGVMDRIDSILFTAPAVAMILLFWR